MPSAIRRVAVKLLSRRERTTRANTAVYGGLILLAGAVGLAGSAMIRPAADDTPAADTFVANTLPAKTAAVDTSVFHEPVSRVRVNADTGWVRIRAGTATTGATVVSRRTSSQSTARHHESVGAGLLDVTADCPSGLTEAADSCTVNFDITIPRGTDVNVTTSTGDVNVTGTNSPITIRTTSGAIQVHRTTGPVHLTSKVGSVAADQVNGGTVSTETSTGDIRLSFSAAPDRAQATSNTGNVHLEVPKDGTPYRVHADPALGGTHINLPTSSTSLRELELNTNTGRIEAEVRTT